MSTCSIVPYHNWNFFGLSMVFYASKIFLRYAYLVCILLLVFLQYLGWCNPSRCQTLHQIKCGLRAAESYVELDGSSPNARLVANAIENRSQSAPFFAAVLA